jgi:hypothetical protein
MFDVNPQTYRLHTAEIDRQVAALRSPRPLRQPRRVPAGVAALVLMLALPMAAFF